MNLPTNSSLSVTLSQSDLRTHTTASCSSQSGSNDDVLILNGQKEDLSQQKRTTTCFALLRKHRAELEAKDSDLPKLSSLPLRITTRNNFPTAAGLASSAAGFAALVFAIATLYRLPLSGTQLSEIARQGSGSACRSLFGGYVAWDAGNQEDGTDSVAREVAPSSHWPEMRALILVASSKKKAVSSTAGMQETVRTSELFADRVRTIVPQRMKAMEDAVHRKDFEKFAELTMRDSNTFHACCADTYPPIYYMTDVSRAAVRLVEAVNAKAGKAIAAYTFDAGPNCVVYYLEEHGRDVAGFFKHFLNKVEGWDGERGDAVEVVDTAYFSQVKDSSAGADAAIQTVTDGIGRVILTAVGDGPQVVNEHVDESQ